jgi:murein DD-endopeptidase MepM/ murein hydrolase activator NlpD
VTRDLSWHPHKYTPRRRPNVWLWLLVALLIAVNIAVFIYHGDPRDLLTKPQHAPSSAWHPARLVMGYAHAQTHPSGWAPTTSHAPKATPTTTMGPLYPIDPLAELRSPGMVQRLEVVRMGEQRTASHALIDGGVRPKDVKAALLALGHVVDLHRLRASDQFKMRFDAAGELVSVELTRGPLEHIMVTRQDGAFVGTRQAIGVDTLVAEVTGEVTTTLWDSLIGAGEDPRLVAQLVDIFAYEVDFYSEVRTGDSFRLLIEKRYVRGQFIGYGDMLAAELMTGAEAHRAFLYKVGSRAEYYDENGAAMRKQLLRTPLQYGTVTSPFGRRRHPILGWTRAHNGVDYGVPIGTPVWSVGDGRVVRAAYNSGFGRVVEVSHPNGWVSQYAHLSKINVHKGQHVRQKEVVGLVGMTGLATGPHLHYGLKKNGVYVNSLAQHFDRASGLTGTALATFQKQAQQWVLDLRKIRVAERIKAPPAQPSDG